MAVKNIIATFASNNYLSYKTAVIMSQHHDIMINNMVDSIGLTNEEMQRLVAVLSTQLNIERAIVYGSRAKGTNRRFSDVNMALVGKNLSHSDLNQVAMKIDDLLLPYEFDLSLYSSLTNENLIEHIKRVGKVIYES